MLYRQHRTLNPEKEETNEGNPVIDPPYCLKISRSQHRVGAP